MLPRSRAALTALAAFAQALPERFDTSFDLLFDATLGEEAVDRFLRAENPEAREAMRAAFMAALAPRPVATAPQRGRGAAGGGRMNAAPRGWCPGVHQPMSMPDGLMVRVKPHAGVLPPLAASALAKAAAREGCAAILLTGRANFQLRGLTAAGAERFAVAMVECGLADADPSLERRRNLIVSPLAGADPAVDPATRPIADAIAAGLRDPAFEGLPDKFGFVVDGGGCLPLGEVSGDVRLRAEGGEWLVWPSGAASSARHCRAEDAPAAALVLARMFLARGGRRRMRGLAASAPLPPTPSRNGRGLFRVLLPLPLREGVGGEVPPFAPLGGILAPTRLAALARHGTLRLTPWRVLLLPSFAEPPP